MKIIAVQPDCSPDAGGWDEPHLERLLLDACRRQVPDLVVFPELFPFCEGGKDAPTLEKATELLLRVSRNHRCAFVAGGYARFVVNGYAPDERRPLRNFIVLIRRGEVVGEPYFKQLPWGPRRNGKPTGELVDDFEIDAGPPDQGAWQLDEWTLVPRICNDVFSATGELLSQTEMLCRPDPDHTLIVAPSFPGEPTGNRWKKALLKMANYAPVLFVSPRGFDESDGDLLGGGGSRVVSKAGDPCARPGFRAGEEFIELRVD